MAWKEAERRGRFGMTSPDSCLIAKLGVMEKWCVHEVLHAQLPENTQAAGRGTGDEETCTGAACGGCGGQEQRAGLRGEAGDLAEVHFHDAGGPSEGSQESPADARRLVGGQLPTQPDDCTKAGTGRERHGGPSGRDEYVADQASRHTTHLERQGELSSPYAPTRPPAQDQVDRPGGTAPRSEPTLTGGAGDEPVAAAWWRGRGLSRARAAGVGTGRGRRRSGWRDPGCAGRGGCGRRRGPG